MKMKKILMIIFTICITLLLSGCKETENPIVTMEIENYGTIKMELYPEYAPNTVANFVTLIEAGFYDNNSFHRLMPGFVLQGGDPDGNGSGGPGYTIRGEFSINGFPQNTLSHTTGIVSMARTSSDYNSAGSQFFIVLSDNYTSSLDKQYAAFGKVIEGMDVIQNIADNAEIEDADSGKLKENIRIVKTTVDTKGEKYTVNKYQK
jgi:peptidyl-prolyl cis-trans isomerase B (cyclophilin B)